MSNKSKTRPKKEEAIIRLDLGCGRNKQPGFTGVDLYAPDVEVRHDLFKFPYPFKTDSVSEIHCSHFLEHIPHDLRWPFFEECWRIMKVDCPMKIFVPGWKSERAYGDMTHLWPPVVAMAFCYLSQAWREANKLTYGKYDLRCNWDHQAGPTSIRPEFASKNHEVQVFALTHYFETYDDMWITLVKRPMAVVK